MSGNGSRPPVRVVVSIDTEEDNWQPVREGLSVENIREIPLLGRTFGRLGIRPTFFTTYQVASRPWALGIIRDVVADIGGEIGSHMHPWNTPPLNGPKPRRATMLNNYPAGFQVAKLATLTDAIAVNGGVRPTVFRAGRFGLGPRTVTALLKCGYQVDSSVTPFINWRRFDGGPDFIGAPLHVYRIDGHGDPRTPVPNGPLIEVPLTVGYTHFSFNRWLQIAELFRRRSAGLMHLAGVAARSGIVMRAILSPETNSVEEMVAVSRRVVEAGIPFLHLFFHSSSLRPGLSPFTRSRRDVQKLYDVIERYLEQLSRVATIEFATVGEVAGVTQAPLPVTATAKPVTPVVRGRRLLIVNYHFPPDGSVGGLRWAGLGKYLTRQGWEVHVLSAGGWGKRLVDGMVIHTVERRTTLNDVYNALVQRLRGASRMALSPERGEKRRFPASMFASIRREAAGMLAFPDESRGWLFRAAGRVRDVVRRFEPDIVVSSGPPHSAHLAALWGLRFTHLPLVVDLRDPWSGQSRPWRHHPVYGTTVARMVIPRLEAMVFRAARLIVANTLPLLATLQSQYPGSVSRWLRNGVDLERLQGASPPPYPGLSLAYAGTLYGGRDSRPLLMALRDLLTRRPDIFAAGSKLRIAGDMDEARQGRLEQTLATIGLADCVEMLGLLSPRNALDLLRRSTVAVVLAQDQDLQVPAKLYEVLGMNRVPLVLAERGSATGQEAIRLGVPPFDSDDVGKISRFLEDVFDGRGPKPVDAASAIDYATLAREMGEQLEAVIAGPVANGEKATAILT